jgi:hypothetical protein
MAANASPRMAPGRVFYVEALIAHMVPPAARHGDSERDLYGRLRAGRRPAYRRERELRLRERFAAIRTSRCAVASWASPSSPGASAQAQKM